MAVELKAKTPNPEISPFALRHDRGYDGVGSLECEGQGGPMIEKSLAWLRRTLKALGCRETK